MAAAESEFGSIAQVVSAAALCECGGTPSHSTPSLPGSLNPERLMEEKRNKGKNKERRKGGLKGGELWVKVKGIT
jgi:hypothetical protein